MKTWLRLVLVRAGCGRRATSAPPPVPSPEAAQILADGGWVRACVGRRFADGRLLVRMKARGGVWFLDPKANCPWCWIFVDKAVWVKLGERSASLLSPRGETAEFWNGGPMEKW